MLVCPVETLVQPAFCLLHSTLYLSPLPPLPVLEGAVQLALDVLVLTLRFVTEPGAVCGVLNAAASSVPHDESLYAAKV